MLFKGKFTMHELSISIYVRDGRGILLSLIKTLKTGRVT